jgi:hypothetical protein
LDSCVEIRQLRHKLVPGRIDTTKASKFGTQLVLDF